MNTLKRKCHKTDRCATPESTKEGEGKIKNKKMRPLYIPI
jgi:hypothetical protein